MYSDAGEPFALAVMSVPDWQWIFGAG